MCLVKPLNFSFHVSLSFCLLGFSRRSQNSGTHLRLFYGRRMVPPKRQKLDFYNPRDPLHRASHKNGPDKLSRYLNLSYHSAKVLLNNPKPIIFPWDLF